MLQDCLTPVGNVSSMSMLTGIAGCGRSGILRPSIASSMGDEGSSGAGSVLIVHAAVLGSPDDKYNDISQISLIKLSTTLPMRTGEFWGTDRNFAVAGAALLHI